LANSSNEKDRKTVYTTDVIAAIFTRVHPRCEAKEDTTTTKNSQQQGRRKPPCPFVANPIRAENERADGARPNWTRRRTVSRGLSAIRFLL